MHRPQLQQQFACTLHVAGEPAQYVVVRQRDGGEIEAITIDSKGTSVFSLTPSLVCATQEAGPRPGTSCLHVATTDREWRLVAPAVTIASLLFLFEFEAPAADVAALPAKTYLPATEMQRPRLATPAKAQASPGGKGETDRVWGG